MREEPYDNSTPPTIQIVAPILAWLIPGLGHWSLGYRQRAIFIGIGILSMYICGLLIGSVNVINKTDGFWWYCGQTMIGPATPAINAWRASHKYPDDPADSSNATTYASPSFAKVNEVGTLYTTLAGMLNLMMILDVLYKSPNSTPNRGRRGEDGSAA